MSSMLWTQAVKAYDNGITKFGNLSQTKRFLLESLARTNPAPLTIWWTQRMFECLLTKIVLLNGLRKSGLVSQYRWGNSLQWRILLGDHKETKINGNKRKASQVSQDYQQLAQDRQVTQALQEEIQGENTVDATDLVKDKVQGVGVTFSNNYYGSQKPKGLRWGLQDISKAQLLSFKIDAIVSSVRNIVLSLLSRGVMSNQRHKKP